MGEVDGRRRLSDHQNARGSLVQAVHNAGSQRNVLIVVVVVEHVGPAMVLTSVAACIGFFSLMSSAFVPIRSFGLLAGVAMIVALLADQWLVRSLLMVTKGRGLAT